ncbi:MAG: helicase-related protein [Bacteriovoracaceae bacterium]|nr:helicase-related protein [Bacteriovoracaceae bacterium]
MSNFFEEIKESLSLNRKAFVQSGSIDESFLRSSDEALSILEVFEKISMQYDALIEEHHCLESLFEKDFGKAKIFKNRQQILDICFWDEYIFPDKQMYFVDKESKLDLEVLFGYYDDFKSWCYEVTQKHIETQDLIKNNYSLDLKQKDLACQCIKCHADFKAKLRDFVYKSQVEEINRCEQELFDLIVENDISYLCDYVQKLKKRLEKEVHKIRYRLKRGSLNRLSSDVKAHMKTKFSYSSELGQVYKDRLISYFSGHLDEMGHNPDFVSDQEYDRFLIQLGIDIWKSPKFLKRQFESLVGAITSYKRKDISASILRDYLGQFWVHARARRKNRKVIYHMGPTNSGKTWNSIEALSKAKKGCYLAPLRLLASELFDTLNEKGAKTSLLTGEEVIETPGATHYSSTIEMAKMNEEFDCVVIDEIQMITDPSRGWAWTRALVNIDADEIHLAGDHSVLELVQQILKLTGDTLEVNQYERKTSLSVEKNPIKLVDLQKNDALIVFSRRNALKYKRDLENLKFKVSIVYGRLSPEVRREQARKFDEGETDIMVSTDAIAMGMNLPVKRIVFSTLAKFYDSKEHFITNSEIKQIAGRAGRFGRFPEGYVTTLQGVDDGLEKIKDALSHTLKQSELAMVGPDLDIFRSVNHALEDNSLPTLRLSEFLRLFNTMTFEKPFYCVDLKEMIEVTTMVEAADEDGVLSDAEVFGFACAPVNLGLMDHVQYYIWILNNFVKGASIESEPIDTENDDIDYLEKAIKCVELYQWLSRHFNNKNFSYDISDLLNNKSLAVEKLNELLSKKVAKKCSSCGVKLAESHDFNICEPCFSQRRGRWRSSRNNKEKSFSKKGKSSSSSRPSKKGGKSFSKKKKTKSKSKASAYTKG